MTYEKTADQLNQVLIDLNQLYFTIRQTHWYMRDTGFLFYHPLMDEWMDEVDEQIDVVAERIITIGGDPVATLREMADKTSIPDQKTNWQESVPEQLGHLLSGYRTVNDEMKKANDVAEEAGDVGTTDFLPTFISENEKRIWMIAAELKKSPGLDQSLSGNAGHYVE